MTALLAALANGAMVSVPIAAVVWLVLRLAPRRLWNAATRYMVWWAALLVTAALPALFVPRPPQPTLLPPVYAAPGEPEPAAIPFPVVELPSVADPVSAPTPGRLHGPAFPIRISAIRWARWIPACWLLASALMLLRLAVSWVRLQRSSARAAEAPAYLRARLGHWLTLCRCRRGGVRLAVSADVAMPAAVGPRRPTILIPARLLGEMDERGLDQIGLHETAHLARRDDYALLLQRILEALFVLHPVARWIARQIDLQREIACDDFVLVAAGESQSYASCLTRVVELSAGAHLPMTAAATGRRSQLVERVELLLDKTRHTGTRLLKVRLAAVLAGLAALAWMAGRAPGALAFGSPGGIALQVLLPRLAVPLFFAQAAPTPPRTPEPTPPAKPEDLCSVEGRVTNAVTGEPLKKASVVFDGRASASPGIFMTTTYSSPSAFRMRQSSRPMAVSCTEPR